MKHKYITKEISLFRSLDLVSYDSVRNELIQTSEYVYFFSDVFMFHFLP